MCIVEELRPSRKSAKGENIVPVKYKIDVLAALKEKGFSSYRLIHEKKLGAGSVQKLREGKILAPEGLGVLCELLQLQPGDILEYSPEK